MLERPLSHYWTSPLSASKKYKKKEEKKDKWPDLAYSFVPIDCCVRIKGKPDGLISGDIQS